MTATTAAATRTRRRRRLLRGVLVVMGVVALVVGAAVTLVLRPTLVMDSSDPVWHGSSSDGVGTGDVLPTITGTDYAGQPVTVTPQGRPMALVFVAHWCTYCKGELKELGEARASGAWVPSAPVVAVPTRHLPFVSWPPQDELELEPAADQVLVDTSSSLARRLGVTGVPQWFFTDADGVIRESVTGVLDPDEIDRYLSLAAQASGSGGG